MNKENKEEAFFGNKKVSLDEKQSMVNEVFDSVYKKYDLMNDVLSLGMHRLWKERFVNFITSKNLNKLLDVGGGTGDIAFNYLKKGGDFVRVVDINKNMLEIGKERAINKGILENIEWNEGNAEDLHFCEDESYSAYSISFCIRNVSNIDKVLREAYRVLKRGGYFYCLEFSNVNNTVLSSVYDAWSFKLMPKLGELIAKDYNAYEYLVESIRKFPRQDTFKQMIEEAGFSGVSYFNLSFGIAAVHYGIKK